MSEVKLTDENFESQVLSSPGVSIVDFWAEWCGPCRMLGPIIADIAESNAGKVKVCKLNVDENPVTASRYGIMSIPTVMFFKDGKVVDTMVGVRPKAEFQRKIDSLLA